MDRIKIMTFFIIFLIMSSLPVVRVAKANPLYPSTVWKIQSPQNLSNYNTYNLNFTVFFETDELSGNRLDVYYNLDGQKTAIIATLFSQEFTDNAKVLRKTYRYSTILPELSDGQHTLTIYQIDYLHQEMFAGSEIVVSEAKIIFNIDRVAPIISNLSVNRLDAGDLLLNFTVDEPASCVSYSLNNQANVTVNGDIVLKELPNGSHSLIVYANDSAGNVGISEALSFTVNNPTIDSLDLFPNITISILIIIVAIICGGLVFYLKKIKR